MRVALITPTLRANGGVAVHVRRSKRAFSDKGHQVLVVSADSGSGGNRFSLRGLGQREGLTAEETSRLVALLIDEAIDVVHFHGVEAPELVRRVSAVAATVVSAHNWSGCGPGTRYFGHGEECLRAHGPLCVPNMLVRNCKHTRSPADVPRFYRRAFEQLDALRAAHVVVAHSSAMVNHLAQNEVQEVRLVPYPIPAPAHVTAPGSEPLRVAFVGRLTQVKGADVLLRSASRFDAHIDVCGDGYRRQGLERLAKRLGINDRVTFHGWCSGPETDAIYERASVVAFPSIYPEPFGMVGAEALAHARPVVASQTGGVLDWLDDGVSGAAVPPGDPMAMGFALRQLLESPERLVLMGNAGRRAMIDRFSDHAHTEALLAAYWCALGAASQYEG